MEESNVPISTKTEEEMIQIAKEMWYTREELDVAIEALKFFDKCGFGFIPQYITEMILDKISKKRFEIPWLELNSENIHLRNGNFWETWEKKLWLSLEAKRNLVKFVNKAIYGYVEAPLDIEKYAKWTSRVNKEKFLHFCFEQWVILDKEKDIWDHHKIIKNLKYKPAIYNHES